MDSNINAMNQNQTSVNVYIDPSNAFDGLDHTRLLFKGTLILFQFLFLMEKSILYAKIAVSQKKFFFKT